ncbi:MAG TPA: hypothetical protein VJJ81_01810 [Candidatus Babeliales bacterium]|nr:hypothetical protein [Candidatus Babeliales bacterium]
MNLVIILTVCTVLLIYCNHSWQQLALAADLEFQRAMHMQNFYRCEGLLNYGKVLFKQNYLKLKALETKIKAPKKQSGLLDPASKRSQILYHGPWPLLNTHGQLVGQLIANFNLAKKNWVLHSTLLDQAEHVLCQISCTLELISNSNSSNDQSKQQLKVNHWVQN